MKTNLTLITFDQHLDMTFFSCWKELSHSLIAVHTLQLSCGRLFPHMRGLFGEGSKIHSLPVFKKKNSVVISLFTPILLFRPGSVHSGWVSWDDRGRVCLVSKILFHLFSRTVPVKHFDTIFMLQQTSCFRSIIGSTLRHLLLACVCYTTALVCYTTASTTDR